MNYQIRVPPFGRFLDQLNAAGLETRTARGFWGGVTPTGEIIVTTWIDQNLGQGRFAIWRPRTNHGGLKTAWEVGNIHVGTEVRVILVRNRGPVPDDDEAVRSVADAALLPGKWRVVKMGDGHECDAAIEPMPQNNLDLISQ